MRLTGRRRALSNLTPVLTPSHWRRSLLVRVSLAGPESYRNQNSDFREQRYGERQLRLARVFGPLLSPPRSVGNLNPDVLPSESAGHIFSCGEEKIDQTMGRRLPVWRNASAAMSAPNSKAFRAHARSESMTRLPRDCGPSSLRKVPAPFSAREVRMDRP